MPRQVTVVRACQAPVQQFDWGCLQWLAGDELVPGAAQTLGLATILPGKHNPLHYHPNCEEVLYVVSGRCRHRFDDEWVGLEAGDSITIPAGVRHNLVNTLSEPLRCVICFSSPRRETVFLEE